ncbi:MAG: hypothetical protein AAGK32_08985 [Actinomycetota bacterium]
MAVSLDPAEFALVLYDPARIVALAEQVRDDIGLPADADITVQIDESTPLTRRRIESIDPIVLSIQSGAFEEPKTPRGLSEPATADVLGRMLFRVRDRLDGDFGDPPDEADLTPQQRNAWDTYSVARMRRLGYPAQRQRRLRGPRPTGPRCRPNRARPPSRAARRTGRRRR